MRTSVESLPRKNEILDAAERVFFDLGYSRASVNDILGLAGIAKGTFYYYFESKEEVLDAIIARRGESVALKAREAVTSMAPIGERLLAVLMSLQPLSSLFPPLFDFSAGAADGIIFLKSLTDSLERISPILGGVIEEGAELGVFSTPFALESAKILISAVHALFANPLLTLDPDETQRLFSALIIAAERVLGAKDGALMILSGAV